MILLATLLAASPSLARPLTVGHATLVVHSVVGIMDVTRETVAPNDPVYWQELIETGAGSAAKLLFVDDTTLSTGPNSRVRIDEFVYSADGGGQQIVINIGRGVLRFVTGSSPATAYSIRTPSAMIGVRGTDFTVSVDDAGATRLVVRRGRVIVTPDSPATPIEVPQDRAITIEAGGMPVTNEPVLPDREQQAEGAEISALLAIAGVGDPTSAFDDKEVAAVRSLSGSAASARSDTAANQLGAGCSGC